MCQVLKKERQGKQRFFIFFPSSFLISITETWGYHEIFIHSCVCVCVCVYIYIYIYIYMYIYIYINSRWFIWNGEREEERYWLCFGDFNSSSLLTIRKGSRWAEKRNNMILICVTGLHCLTFTWLWVVNKVDIGLKTHKHIPMAH